MSFETDNQDKSNLVGDAKLMSDAVDCEQELIRVNQECRDVQIEYYKLVKGNIKPDKERLRLIDEVSELKELNASLKQEVADLRVIRVLLSHKLESIRGES